jgi:hypothetical protein
MPGEFSSSVMRSVELPSSALDQSGSNEMSGVYEKADARSAEGKAVGPRYGHTEWVGRGSAEETSTIFIPHIVKRVGRLRNSLTEQGRGNSDLTGCRRQDDRMKPKARGGPEARPVAPKRWSKNQQRPEPGGNLGQVERQNRRPHPIRKASPGPGRQNATVFMATMKESKRCRLINIQ